MGIDAFIVYFGARKLVDDEGEVKQLEEANHPWLLLSREHRLEMWWGAHCPSQALSNTKRFYVALGTLIGVFGSGNSYEKSLTAVELTQVMEQTKSRLAATGIQVPPEMHFQFQPDF